MKPDLLREILPAIDHEFANLNDEQQEQRVRHLLKELALTRLMNLTEFGRAVHAEMEALLAAARVGTSTRGTHLYTTTFPCHNCAKHIVAAGVKRVVYIEPYPKSLAIELHEDSIRFAEEDLEEDDRVCFESFTGVAPRRFATLFAMVLPDGTKYRRKDSTGRPLKAVQGLRTKEAGLNYPMREAVAAYMLADVADAEQQELDFGEEEDFPE